LQRQALGFLYEGTKKREEPRKDIIYLGSEERRIGGSQKGVERLYEGVGKGRLELWHKKGLPGPKVRKTEK